MGWWSSSLGTEAVTGKQEQMMADRLLDYPGTGFIAGGLRAGRPPGDE